MIAAIPRSIRLAAVLGLAALAAAVPFSNPDGTGMQWDELVLGAVAAFACWQMARVTRAMETTAARPWRVMIAGAALFATAQWLEAAFPGPAFDGFGVDKVFLFAGGCSPLATCAFLALRVSRTRWTALAVDGLMIALGLFVVSAVITTPGIRPGDAPADLRATVLMYGGYAAVMLGGAGALCTVSTRALRRAVSLLMGAVACQATAAMCEAMAILAPHPLWTAGSDAAVLVGLLLALCAATRAPLRDADRGARAAAPQVSVAGMFLVVLGVLALPFALGLSLLAHQPLSSLAELGCAVVFVLVAARLVLRIREDGRISEDLVQSEEDFRDLVEASSDGVAIVDDAARLLFTSPAARSLLGIVPDAEHAISLLDPFAGAERERLAAALRAGVPVHVGLATGDGSTRELEVVFSDRPGHDRRVVFLRDVTSRRRRERELERMAYTDHLTGLPNRVVLFQELADAGARPGSRCLLVLDLDGFKEVNDSAGHEAGDQLLVEVARRLHTAVRTEDLVARLGGDEFAVLVTGTLEEAVDVAERVVEALGLPHRTGTRTFAVGASVGVALVGAGGGQPAFRHADAALRRAKQAGKGCVRVAHDDVVLAASCASDLAGALAGGALTLRFDTACDPGGRPALVHAVPVWLHPSLGPVRGVELWTAAAQQGATGALQEWLLRSACAAVRDLDPTLVLAVSLAPGQVSPDGLTALVADALEETGLPASRLLLSLTEETLLTSSAALVPELEAVRALGVGLCLDNYGMGQSLFGLLARIELDVVRADLTALNVRDDAERTMRVLDAIVTVTSGFGLTLIAGGAHTAELRDAAASAGAPLLHGRSLPHDLDTAALAALLDRAVSVR